MYVKYNNFKITPHRKQNTDGLNSEAQMAKKLGIFYWRNCRSIEDKRPALSKQDDHPEAADRRRLITSGYTNIIRATLFVFCHRMLL